MAKQVSYLKSLTGDVPKSIVIKRKDARRIEREQTEREKALKAQFGKKKKERKKPSRLKSALKGALRDATSRKGRKYYATSKRTSKRRKKGFGLSLGGVKF